MKKRSRLYFAYGSNMNSVQMRHRCPSSSPYGNASLEGVQITFCGRSKWGGGVASIKEGDGATEGVVWSLTDSDIACLDRYEGAPVVYRKVDVQVIMDNGMIVDAFTYIKNDTRQALPATKYIGQIIESYEDQGFDLEPLFEALEEIRSDADSATAVFVYGSLMRGFGNHRLLSHADFKAETSLTTTSHGLTSLGAFPALIPTDDMIERTVHGELYEVDDYTLDDLDRLEGHPTFYERREVVLDNGRRAWTYFLKGAHYHDHGVIESGSWRAERDCGSRWKQDSFRWTKLSSDFS